MLDQFLWFYFPIKQSEVYEIYKIKFILLNFIININNDIFFKAL